MQSRAVKSPSVIDTLKELRKHTRGRLILIWDRLLAHRSKETQEFLKTQKDRLSVEYFPPYAPDLDPVEYLWSSLKGKDVPNYCPDTIENLDKHVQKGAQRIRRHPEILKGFLKESGLFGRSIKVMGGSQ